MAITLEQLTAGSDKKYRMLLLGGRTGLENSVRWVHMVEDREVPDFLHGNELVFTTGIGHIKGARLFEFVESLYKHGAAGIVVNLGPYIHDIPSHVVAYCDNAGFPIFSLPWDVHIIDITFDYCSRIIENEKIETTAASALTDIFQRGDFREEYTQALKKAGISNDKSLRVAAFCFLQRGADVTEAIYEKNRHKLWKILGLSKKTSALLLYKRFIVAVKGNFTDTQAEKIIAQLIAGITSGNLKVHMGISDIAVGYETLPLLQRESFAALCSGRCDGSSLTFYRDIGMDKVICNVRRITVLRDFADKLLSKLSEHDDLNKTNLLKFLSVYLECDCSVKATAEELAVHRNTVNYQIRQTKNVLGMSLNAAEKANLLFAMRIKNLLDKGVLI